VLQADFEHISLIPFEHINRLGKYSFDANLEFENPVKKTKKHILL
jgi:hypothetical protein